MYKDFLNLLYPTNCYRCNDTVHLKEKYFCFRCEHLLPHFDNSNPKDNLYHNRLFNKIQINEAFGLFEYKKNSPVQELIHDFKYGGIETIGKVYGTKLGNIIKKETIYAFDVVISVPMHSQKFRNRGFNQSELLAKEIAKNINAPLLSTNIEKTKNTSSQTKFSRLKRWDNSKEIYKVSADLKGKHALLIDDIFTTGSTMEAFGLACMAAGCHEISIATMAIAV